MISYYKAEKSLPLWQTTPQREVPIVSVQNYFTLNDLIPGYIADLPSSSSIRSN